MSRGEALRQARKKAGLTQAAAAGLLGYGCRTVEDWEHDRRNMPAAVLDLFRIIALADDRTLATYRDQAAALRRRP